MPKRKASTFMKEIAEKVPKTCSNLDGFLKIPKNKDIVDANSWHEEKDMLIFSPNNIKGCSKIAAFDLDYTLTKTKSGKKWPKSWDDWTFLFFEVPAKLKALVEEGFKVVVFTNQGGVEKGNTKVGDLKKKFNNIVNTLGFSFQIFASLKYNTSHTRKPVPGMFEMLQNQHNEGVKIDLKESIYVGDAAGRPANWAPAKKKDFSANDRLFALNCGLAFKTPEEFFLGHSAVATTPLEFEPCQAVENVDPLKIHNTEDDSIHHKMTDAFPTGFPNKTLIVLIGCPGSGKSTFCKTYLEPLGFETINRDTLKTAAKCEAAAQTALQAGRSVVVDNTSPDRASRSIYVNAARQCGAESVIALLLDVSVGRSRHNEAFRRLTKKNHEKVGELVFRIYKSKFTEPTKEEGFTAVFKVTPELRFEDDEKKKLYSLYLSD